MNFDDFFSYAKQQSRVREMIIAAPTSSGDHILFYPHISTNPRFQRCPYFRLSRDQIEDIQEVRYWPCYYPEFRPAFRAYILFREEATQLLALIDANIALEKLHEFHPHEGPEAEAPELIDDENGDQYRLESGYRFVCQSRVEPRHPGPRTVTGRCLPTRRDALEDLRQHAEMHHRGNTSSMSTQSCRRLVRLAGKGCGCVPSFRLDDEIEPQSTLDRD